MSEDRSREIAAIRIPEGCVPCEVLECEAPRSPLASGACEISSPPRATQQQRPTARPPVFIVAEHHSRHSSFIIIAFPLPALTRRRTSCSRQEQRPYPRPDCRFGVHRGGWGGEATVHVCACVHDTRRYRLSRSSIRRRAPFWRVVPCNSRRARASDGRAVSLQADPGEVPSRTPLLPLPRASCSSRAHHRL